MTQVQVGHGYIDVPDETDVANPLAVSAPGQAIQCSLIGDVTGNNFHGNWACFELGIQVGNPMQYGGRYNGSSQTGLPGPGGMIFMGFGGPPPNQYGPNGSPATPSTYPFKNGAWYFELGNGGIYFYTGTSWVQKL